MAEREPADAVTERDDSEAKVPAPFATPLAWHLRATRTIVAYFTVESIWFWTALVPALVLSAVLYTRSVTSNFIFDEQEALLANPYVNGRNLGFWQAVHRDFWGLPPDRSVGSYRPIPDMIWRIVADVLRAIGTFAARLVHAPAGYSMNPWVFHWCNVVIHAVNGALLGTIVFYLTKDRLRAWLAGGIFVATAVLTEAVSGVVGIADVLGGLSALLALASLRYSLGMMPVCVFFAMLLGLFSKETAIVSVPLVPLAAAMFAKRTHPARPLPLLRGLAALAATSSALFLYVLARKRWFPSALPPELTTALAPDASFSARTMRALLVWFHQPGLPKDPLNNPFVDADAPHRIAGALRVFFRGITQLVFPWTLSGDYSFPQEPIPERVFFPASVLGGVAMVGLPLLGLALWAVVALREKKHDATGIRVAETSLLLVALGLVWIPVSYFPHSNIPVLLPTVRAERFLYFPALGSSVILACLFARVFEWGKTRDKMWIALSVFIPWALFQCAKARLHALDYADDLTFWRATRDAAPRSAKAHLNYSVMWGARGHLDTRLAESHVAVDLAPSWPMAHVYLGDTLCRLHRAEEGWPHYARGIEMAKNDPNLIALALQCLWDEKTFEPHKTELVDLADKHPTSWLDFLVKDIVNNGEEHGGVDPKYRPRGYNEGPKD